MRGTTGPFTGPRSGRTALESGKARYGLACKAVYTGSIPVGAFRSEGANLLRSLLNEWLVTRKRDIKQFRQACKEVGLSARERFEASKASHVEKRSGGLRRHAS